MAKLKIISLVICFLYVQIKCSSTQTNTLLGKDESYQYSNNQIEKVIQEFTNTLNEEEKIILPLYDNIQAVKRNLENIKNLIRTELQNAQGFQIDFIPQYELGVQKNAPKWAHDSIERYQAAVKNYLLESSYDLVGWESSALDTVTHQKYEQELLGMWREVNPNFTVNTPYIFEWFTSQYMWQDGVLAYWASNPKANLVGTQEASLWKLNLKANAYDIHFSNKVAEFRSYVAIAKMIRKMRENKLKQPIRAVIVMGAWHQADITIIAKALGIKIKIINMEADK